MGSIGEHQAQAGLRGALCGEHQEGALGGEHYVGSIGEHRAQAGLQGAPSGSPRW